MLAQFVSQIHLEQLFSLALDEDLGSRGDISTASLGGGPGAVKAVRLVSRQSGVVAGLAAVPTLLRMFSLKHSKSVSFDAQIADGAVVSSGDMLGEVDGELASILAIERTLLNTLTHLSGIASYTAAFLQEAQKGNPEVKICDTRKTHLGFRGLEKYAVHLAGGTSHRLGLFDAVLFKDNHLALLPVRGQLVDLEKAIKRCRNLSPAPKFVQLEVDNIDQLEMFIGLDLDIVLLDNMGVTDLEKAVELRNRLSPKVLLEASGGVSLDNVRQIAETGVDRISVGALTHSAPALDIGLDFES